MRYAQSILELLQQLHDDGYRRSELRLVRDAYALAMRAFTGLVRPSGKLFIDHVVGTASVLHVAGAPPAVTCTGLLHSVYAHGAFGRRRKGVTESSRREVRAVVGAEIEQLVAGYAELRWNRSTVPVIATELAGYDAIGRGVVLARLANEVDEHLDGGVLRLPDAERRRRADMLILPFLTAMADELGRPGLSSELRRSFEETMSAMLPTQPMEESPRGVSIQVPRSCRRRVHSVLAGVASRIPGLAR